MAVTRTPVDPWPWSVEQGLPQAEVVEGARREVFCAGQAAISADGRPEHPGDMAAQMSLALDDVEEVVRAAGMSLADVVRLTFYTTDVDAFSASAGVPTQRLAAAGARPVTTLLGVSRLALPELLVELEATAVA